MSAFPDEAGLRVRLRYQLHLVDYAEGALALAMDESVEAHGVKDLDYRFIEHGLHNVICEFTCRARQSVT